LLSFVTRVNYAVKPPSGFSISLQAVLYKPQVVQLPRAGGRATTALRYISVRCVTDHRECWPNREQFIICNNYSSTYSLYPAVTRVVYRPLKTQYSVIGP